MNINGLNRRMDEFKEYLTGIFKSRFSVYGTTSDVKIFLSNYDKLDNESIGDFVQQQTKDGKDNKTINRRIISLKHYADFQGVILGKIKSLRGQRRIDKINLVSEQDLFKIRSHIDGITSESGFNQMRIKIIMVMLNLGLRRSELLDLKVSDISLDEGKMKFVGKGGKGTQISLYSRVGDFVDYLELRSQMNPKDDSVLIWKYETGYSKLGVREFYKLLYDFTELVIGRRANPHSFRHGLATVLLDKGTDLRTIQEALRHSSISITEIYTHVSVQKIRNAMESNHPIFQ